MLPSDDDTYTLDWECDEYPPELDEDPFVPESSDEQLEPELCLYYDEPKDTDQVD